MPESDPSSMRQPSARHLRRCPECAGRVIPKAMKAGLTLIYACPSHGLIDHWSEAVPRLMKCTGGTGRMHPEERLWLIHRAIERFLSDPLDKDFVILEDPAAPDHYVQLMHHGEQGVIYVEAGSREWNCKYCGNRPLPAHAVAALSDLGFTIGGDRRNYARDGIPYGNPLDLAGFVERLFFIAYEPRVDFEVAVQFKRDDELRQLRTRLLFERVMQS